MIDIVRTTRGCNEERLVFVAPNVVEGLLLKIRCGFVVEVLV